MSSPFPLLAAVATAVALAGLWLAVVASVPSWRETVFPERAVRPGRSRPRFSRRTRALLPVGLVAGVLAWLISGLVVAVVVVPLAVVGVPMLLLRPSSATSLPRLEALEEWTRSLAGVLTVGVGLEQAILATQRSTPAALEADVARLASRIRARWPTAEALRAFADDLDDATGDLVAASLVLASRRRGRGLADLLSGLADTAAEELRMRRAIEAERARPRATARWITLITTVFLGLLALTGDFLSPYATPAGQVILLVLLGVFAGALVWLRALTATRPLPRFVGHTVAAVAPGAGRRGRSPGPPTSETIP